MNFPIIAVLVSAVLAGCASAGTPVATGTPLARSNQVAQGEAVETRHAYLFAPGKAPVLLVSRTADTSSDETLSGASRAALHDNSLADPTPGSLLSPATN